MTFTWHFWCVHENSKLIFMFSAKTNTKIQTRSSSETKTALHHLHHSQNTDKHIYHNYPSKTSHTHFTELPTNLLNHLFHCPPTNLHTIFNEMSTNLTVLNLTCKLNWHIRENCMSTIKHIHFTYTPTYVGTPTNWHTYKWQAHKLTHPQTGTHTNWQAHKLTHPQIDMPTKVPHTTTRIHSKTMITILRIHKPT